MKLFLTLMLVAVFLIGCGTYVDIKEEYVDVKEEKELSQITFQIVGKKNCRPSFHAPLNRKEKWGLSYQSNCSLPLSQLSPLMSMLLDAVAKKVDLDTVGWVSWEPIYDSELSSRLAIAAFRSPEWDRKKGQPKSLPLHVFIERLMNEERVFGDVIDVFAQHGIRIEVASVEKVGISEAKDLSFFERLKMNGVDSGDKLPTDCLVSLSVVEKAAKAPQAATPGTSIHYAPRLACEANLCEDYASVRENLR